MQIALNQLKPNPKNVRKVVADNLDKLIASIKSRDLLHNLVVQKNGSGFNVIDGNRRLEALFAIHGKSSNVEVECKLIEDNTTEVGAMANMLREDMHPLDEAEAINQVVSDGLMDYNTLAANWGQTNKWVLQRVALADLSPTVKDAFRNKEFGLGIAQLFTNVDQETQDKIFADCNGRYDYDNIKYSIGNVKISKSRVIIDPKHSLYKNIEFAGDLFDDGQYVANMDKFLALQQEYVDEKAKYYNKKFKDCTVIDCHPSEVKGLIKNLIQVYEYDIKKEEIDPKDINVVITYQPYKGNFWVQKYKSKIEMSKKELDAIESGEIPELTLADMSNPQRELTHNLYYNYLRSEFWKAGDGYTDGHVALAMICNNIVRPSYFADNYSEVGKYFVTYTDTPFNKITGVDDDYFDNLTEEIIKYCKTNKCNSLEYFLNQKPSDLHNVLYKGLVASMGESQAFQSQKDHYHIPVAKDWFKPSEEWLNKYKITQLRLLAHKVKCKLLPHDNKKLVIEKLVSAFKDGAVFDPIKFLDTVK